MHDARTKAVTGRWTSGGEQEHGTSGGELEQGTSSGEDEHGTSGDEQRGACGAAGTSSIGGMRGRRDEECGASSGKYGGGRSRAEERATGLCGYQTSDGA
jgi:hypothetical protein